MAKAAREGLRQLGYLDEAAPARFGVWVVEPGQEEAVRLPNRAATYRASRSFEALAARHGINGLHHFRQAMPAWPLALHAGKKPGFAKKGRQVVTLPGAVGQSPKVVQIVQEMREINHFLDGFSLTRPSPGRPGKYDPAFFGLYRIFTLPAGHSVGRLDEYRWDHHGRIYARSSGGLEPYQSIKSDLRKGLVIDGETVVELDVRAAWPTLIYGLVRDGLPDFNADRWLSETSDPYSLVPDLATGRLLPRDVVKAASSILLTNAGACLRRWPEEAIETLQEDHPHLVADYPPAQIGRALLAAHPHLAIWKRRCCGNGLVLMHREAGAMLATIRRAMTAGVPAYPLHDALLVPESQAELVHAMIVEEFFRAFGVRPHVRMKA